MKVRGNERGRGYKRKAHFTAAAGKEASTRRQRKDSIKRLEVMEINR